MAPSWMQLLLEAIDDTASSKISKTLETATPDHVAKPENQATT